MRSVRRQPSNRAGRNGRRGGAPAEPQQPPLLELRAALDRIDALDTHLHSYLTESVGSQGCVGLTDDNAKALFVWAPVGTSVVIITEEE